VFAKQHTKPNHDMLPRTGKAPVPWPRFLSWCALALALPTLSRSIYYIFNETFSNTMIIRTATRMYYTHKKSFIQFSEKNSHIISRQISEGSSHVRERKTTHRPNALPAPKKKAAHQLTKKVWNCSCLQPPAHRPFRPTSSIPRSAMAAPAEETLAAEDTASPPPPARSAGFWFLGEDKSVHKALGGGKSMSLFLIFLSYIVIFLSFFFAS
jgi:hypothetical protein